MKCLFSIVKRFKCLFYEKCPPMFVHTFFRPFLNIFFIDFRNIDTLGRDVRTHFEVMYPS